MTGPNAQKLRKEIEEEIEHIMKELEEQYGEKSRDHGGD